MALKTEKPGSLALLLTIVVAIAITATAQEYEDPNAVVVARSAVAGGRKFTPVVAQHRGAPLTGAITDPEDLAFIIPPENLEAATAVFVQGPSRARYSPTDGSLIAVGMPTVDMDVTASESGGVITARAAVAATAVASKIDNSQCLATGACITSPSGRFKLCVQGDANIVLYDGSTPYWATNTVGRATGPRLCMQGNGNVVAYGNTGRAYWASNTAGRGLAPNTLYIQNDGNLVAYNKDCRAFWATGARSGTAAVAAPCAAVTPPPTTSLAQEILNLVNTQRRNNGKQPLVLSNELTRAAQLHSNEMLSRKQIFHDNPFTGLTFSARVRRDAPNHGGKCAMGENVASGYQTAQAVMTGWMNSPGHRENILRDNYRSMGLARADPGFYWTQLFSSCPSP